MGYHGIYELRLYRGDGPAIDPVVDAAGQVQGVLAGRLDRIGPLPLLLLLAVLLGGTVLLGGIGLFTRSSRRHYHTPPHSGPPHSGR